MPGGVALFINSTQGGMVTADNRRLNGKEANDWNECIHIGNLMADEALRIISPVSAEDNLMLYCTSKKKITFPVDNHAMRYF